MLVEHARNLAGVTDAVHAEYGRPGTEVVSALACSLDGTDITLRIRSGTKLAELHGASSAVVERTTCNYGLNPHFRAAMDAHGMVVSATDESKEVRAVERIDHRYFVATLYQPQLRSTRECPHPVFLGLVRAAGS